MDDLAKLGKQLATLRSKLDLMKQSIDKMEARGKEVKDEAFIAYHSVAYTPLRIDERMALDRLMRAMMRGNDRWTRVREFTPQIRTLHKRMIIHSITAEAGGGWDVSLVAGGEIYASKRVQALWRLGGGVT